MPGTHIHMTVLFHGYILDASTNKSDDQDKAEILLKVALNNITMTT